MRIQGNHKKLEPGDYVQRTLDPLDEREKGRDCGKTKKP